LKSKKLIWLLLLLPFLTAAKPNDDMMGKIHDTWFEHRPADAFEMILETYHDGGTLDAVKLTELTGVRKIDRILEGKGDEKAYFIDDRYVALAGFYHTLRIADMETGKSSWLPEQSYPLVDKQGIIHYKVERIYYLKTNNDSYILYEFNLKSKSSRSLGKFPLEVFMVKYDEENGLLQFNGLEYQFMATFDLDRQKKIETTDRIMQRRKKAPVEVEVTTGHSKLTLRFNDEKVMIPYSREEFLYGYNSEDGLFLDNEHPQSILLKTKWYPGFWILIDIANKRIMKLSLPQWLEPGMKVSWHVTSTGTLYFWKVAGEKAGLYKIIPEEYPTFKEFVDLIYKFNLARRKSGTGNNERA